MSAILRRSESDFQKALIRCNPDDRSPRNGLCSVHFAVVWPTALRRLILAGADIDVQDKIERRPIQLAVVMGSVESVKLLIEADCALDTPHSHFSLLQECLMLEEQDEREQISTLIVQGLINRHTRLLNLASAVLPPSSHVLKLIIPGKLQQSLLPMIVKEMACLGHQIPTALKLDSKGHYETKSYHATIRLPVCTAEQLWRGGFQELEVPSPSEYPNVPLVVQSWSNADCELLRWLISKGASPFSKHPLTGGSGLHWFAQRLRNSGGGFCCISLVPFDMDLVSQLGWDNSAWRDSCSCPCSVGGCQPVTIFLKPNHSGLVGPKVEGFSHTLILLRKFWAKVPPPPQQALAQAEAVLRFYAFDQTNARHVAGCCRVEQGAEHTKRLSWPHPRWREADVSSQEPTLLHDYEMIERKMQYYRRKLRCCGCFHLHRLVCVIFRDTCPNAKRRKIRNRRR